MMESVCKRRREGGKLAQQASTHLVVAREHPFPNTLGLVLSHPRNPSDSQVDRTYDPGFLTES